MNESATAAAWPIAAPAPSAAMDTAETNMICAARGIRLNCIKLLPRSLFPPLFPSKPLMQCKRRKFRNGPFAVVAYRHVMEIHCVVRVSARNGHRVATECA